MDRLLADGTSNVSSISRATHVSHSVIRERRLLLGLPRRGYKRLDDCEALIELTLASKSAEDIARELGVEVHTVRRHQAALGLRDRTRPRGPLTTEQRARAERMLREERTSYLETSRTLNVDVDTLRRQFPGLGWTKEDRANMAAVLQQPALKRLHEEFFGRATVQENTAHVVTDTPVSPSKGNP